MTEMFKKIVDHGNDDLVFGFIACATIAVISSVTAICLTIYYTARLFT